MGRDGMHVWRMLPGDVMCRPTFGIKGGAAGGGYSQVGGMDLLFRS